MSPAERHRLENPTIEQLRAVAARNRHFIAERNGARVRFEMYGNGRSPIPSNLPEAMPEADRLPRGHRAKPYVISAPRPRARKVCRVLEMA